MLENNEFKGQIVGFSYPYAVYLPENYIKEAHFPIVFFLHGAGERQPCPDGVYVHGPLRLAKNGRHFPFICVAPQCPENSFWSSEIQTLTVFIDEMIDKFGADKDRVYLTGLSMGGYGTWHLAETHPDRFAAIVPICGSGIEWAASALKNVPVWAFHGDADSTVPVTGSNKMVDAVNASGGNARLTVYPGVGHDSWTRT